MRHKLVAQRVNLVKSAFSALPLVLLFFVTILIAKIAGFGGD